MGFLGDVWDGAKEAGLIGIDIAETAEGDYDQLGSHTALRHKVEAQDEGAK